MFLKKLLMSTLFIATSALPLLANAGIFGPDLTTTNNTNRDSACVANNGMCSKKVLGEGGVTRKHATNVIAGRNVYVACATNKENCSADIYMTEDCSGPKVGNVVIDIYKGIKSITMFDKSYTITANGFHVFIDGGPAQKA